MSNEFIKIADTSSVDVANYINLKDVEVIFVRMDGPSNYKVYARKITPSLTFDYTVSESYSNKEDAENALRTLVRAVSLIS